MSFNEFVTIEAHLRDRIAGAGSARPRQLSSSLSRNCDRIAGLGWRYVAGADCHYFSVRFRPTAGRGRKM